MNFTHQELAKKAQAASTGELRVWLRDGRKDVRIAARNALRARGLFVPPGVARSRRAAGSFQRQGS